MNIALLYPTPNESDEAWDTFRPFVKRFTDTLRYIDPEWPYEVYPIFNTKWSEELVDLFDGIKHTPIHYPGSGFDIGATQFAAKQLPGNYFTISFSSRCYFHRAGWLKRMALAREGWGRALYCMSATRSPVFHSCSRGYGWDAIDFSNYPHLIETRSLGPFFEVGNELARYWKWAKPVEGGKPFWDWARSAGMPVKVVTFSGIYEPQQTIGMKNCFRNGDQSDILIWDKHTDLYRDGTPHYKREIENWHHNGMALR